MKRFIRRFVGDEHGQVLPLAALMLVALIAIVGLAIDVSGAFMEQRWQRSITDGAALAGGQDLQRPGRLLPDATARVKARLTAVTLVATQLGATSIPDPATDPNCVNAVGCPLPGTPYRVSVYAGVEGVLPRPTCLDCVPERAVQVNLSQPTFGLTFSRILGFSTWDVRASSVAGVVFARQYGVVTLRPTDPRGPADGNEKDLFVTGGSKVIVGDGDVVTNTNVICSGVTSEVQLETAKGFAIYHFDPYEGWVTGSGRCLNPPPGVQVTSPAADPGYSIPQRVTGTGTGPTTDTPVYTTEAQARAMDPAAPNYDPSWSAHCEAQQLLVPATYRELKTDPVNGFQLNDPTKITTWCFKPGVYQYMLDARERDDPVTNLPIAYLLEPGVYFFDYGVNVQSSLIGGYVAGSPGVALVMLEANNTNRLPGQMTTSSFSSLLALNFGDAYLNSSGSWASAAVGPQGLVETPDPNGVLLTLMVEPDRVNCLPIVAVETTACKGTENDRKTLKLTGGGNIFLAGVQYAPTDNVELKGNSGQASDVGAMWAWTITFNSSVFNIRTANPELLGVLRLDRACSPGNLCTR